MLRPCLRGLLRQPLNTALGVPIAARCRQEHTISSSATPEQLTTRAKDDNHSADGPNIQRNVGTRDKVGGYYTRRLSASSVRQRQYGLRPPGLSSNVFNSVDVLEHGNNQTKQNMQRGPRVAVKDNITTTQMPTTAASLILARHISPFEAHVVDRLRQTGVEVIGKTNMDEFGMGSHSTHSYFGPVRNNLGNVHRSIGGSSGGSAVAVARGDASLALGTDTGGSVRLPAAYTGVVGFKPSYGLISRRGIIPYANSLDTVGILSRSVALVDATFRSIRHHDALDPTCISQETWDRLKRELYELRKQPDGGTKRQPGASLPADTLDQSHNSQRLPLSHITIGVPTEYNIQELETGIRRTWKIALRILEKYGGCNIVPVSLPNTKHALSAYYILAPAEAASNLSKYDGIRYGYRSKLHDGEDDVLYSRTRGDGFGDEVKKRILLGSYTLSSEAINNYFIKAQKVRRLVQRDFDRVFSTPNLLRPPEQFDLSDMDESITLDNKLGPSQVDVILCPTAPTSAPTFQDISHQTEVDKYMNDVFTVPASLAGLPSISVPFPIADRQSGSKKPTVTGMQIIGQYGDDLRVLNVAKLFQNLQRKHAPFVFNSIRKVEPKESFHLLNKHYAEPTFRKHAAQGPNIRKYPSRVADQRPDSIISEQPSTGSVKHSPVEGNTKLRKVPTDARTRPMHLTNKELKQELDDAFVVWDNFRV